MGKCEKIEDNFIEKARKCVTIVAIGNMVSRAIEIRNEIAKFDIKTEIINTRFLKPLDENEILKLLKNTDMCITIEDGTINGGLGSSIKELIVDSDLINLRKQRPIKFKAFAYPDKFIEHGSIEKLENKYRMDVNSICKYVKGNLE